VAAPLIATIEALAGDEAGHAARKTPLGRQPA